MLRTCLYMQLMVFLALYCTGSCAIRLPLQAGNSSAAANTNGTQSGFKCGEPMGPCGSAIPAGVTCPKGPGWCPSGYFCGWTENTGQPSRCLPLPQDCGKAGKPCCPSNTDSPHTGLEDKLTKKPFCKDGSTCFYFDTVRGLNNGDSYAGNNGAYACTVVAKDCGTGPGSPCCPSLYHIATNPRVTRALCPGQNQFCSYADVSIPPGTPTSLQSPPASSGTCMLNAADCGQFGKSCCVMTGGAATGLKCGASYGQSGPKGYCANPPSYKGKYSAPLKDLICTQCPDKVDESMKDSNPSLYFSCRSN